MNDDIIDPLEQLYDETIGNNPRSAAAYARLIAELPLSSQLAIIRGRQQVTQARLARKLGVKQPHVARMENPDHDPRLSSVDKQMKALGMRMVFIPKKLLGKVLRLVAEEQAKVI